jgi:plastocyanin
VRALRFAIALTALLWLGMTSTATAAPRTIDVTIQNFTYSPTPITVDPGDTVRWTNLDTAQHSAVSVKEGFVSAVIGQNQSASVTFNDPGTFEYVCAVHGASMKGTVIVRGTPVERAQAAGPVGHLVDDQYQEARPDVFANVPAISPALYLAALLALLAVARFVWVLRHS